ncbi:hypothetical protein CHS0354_042569 [Potamilus streckersoni]|uniref:Uncharacterized protein n=1 Tax=Potamilus streckersoni TaxID=2493646 RepID=A0AAE0WCS3_9BIVA|nr:hypothetical protein CHS0354_042569 [Potamilus streckersoni]
MTISQLFCLLPHLVETSQTLIQTSQTLIHLSILGMDFFCQPQLYMSLTSTCIMDFSICFRQRVDFCKGVFAATRPGQFGSFQWPVHAHFTESSAGLLLPISGLLYEQILILLK